MALWKHWLRWVRPLRPACARRRTFLWLCVILMGFCVREDLLGVTSFVRSLGLDAMFYDRLLDFFHSPALDVGRLSSRVSSVSWRSPHGAPANKTVHPSRASRLAQRRLERQRGLALAADLLQHG